MKHLVECEKCKAQYDATGHTTGSRFHCRCGHLVAVTTPQNDAHLSVIRCSNCGAASEEGRTSCAYCKAQFSLSERDLDMICPHCTARTGSKSKFCHRCGTSIEHVEVIGEFTDIDCPRCKETKLTGRKLGDGIGIQECDQCTGVWLGNSIFKKLETRSVDHAQFITPTLELDLPKNEITLETTKHAYIRCPECDMLMNRVNYSKVSGILLDVCLAHGVWFDADELSRLVHWLEAGGQQVAQQKAKRLQAAEILGKHNASMADLNVHQHTYEDNHSTSGNLFESAVGIGFLVKGFFS